MEAAGKREISPLLTEKEAAALLGFKPSALQAWRLRGDGPPFVKISARAVRYRREDLETFVTERLRISTADTGAAGR